MTPIRFLLSLVCVLWLALPAHADEATIRKQLAQRLKDWPPIDEVSKSAIPGLWEVRVGFDLFYVTPDGNHLIEGGSIIDTRTKTNLTRERLDKLTAIAFDELPLKDALVIKQGSGTRRLAVFGDPNCGYCKRLERDLAALKDVTIYNFIYPVLGPDSQNKATQLWCAKTPATAWRTWMIESQMPPRAMGSCNTAGLERTLAFGRKYRINGTPALVFEDGQRVPGALSGADIEKRLVEARQPRKKTS